MPCSGLHFRDKTYLAQVLACFSQNEAPLRYHCPVSGSILEACPDDLDAVAWDISLEADWNLTKGVAELERLLQAGKLAAVTLDGTLLAQAHPIWRQLMTARRTGAAEVDRPRNHPRYGRPDLGQPAPRHGAALRALLQRLREEPHRRLFRRGAGWLREARGGAGGGTGRNYVRNHQRTGQHQLLYLLEPHPWRRSRDGADL